VFRELLQNSDDAGAHSAEIRFETEGYLSREKGNYTRPDESKQEDLPDLKTAVVCVSLLVFADWCILIVAFRSTAGVPMDVQE